MTRQFSHLYMICYDICGEGQEKRLRKVYKTLRAFGEHLQYSVFRCALTPLQLAELEDELGQIIHHKLDQILIVPLGPTDNQRAWRMYTLGLPVGAPERIVRIV